jgi:predicted Rossmann fold flavoprotein
MIPSSSVVPVVVIGAGAAGLMAALHAAREAGPGRVLLLERTSDGGRKILISGGGRCNVLPSELDPRRYVTDSSPNTLRKILLSWPLGEQRSFFEEVLGIPLALEPETGKLFPRSNKAREVRDTLRQAVEEAGAEIRFGAVLSDLLPPEAPEEGWRVRLEGGGEILAHRVILATGGLSVPATGSDGRGLSILGRLGYPIHPSYPALTPLLTDPPVHAALAGVSLPVTIRAEGVRGRPGEGRPEASGGFLFTHRGYSGPSVLNVSHTAVRAQAEGKGQPLRVEWTGEDRDTWSDRLTSGTGTVGSILRRALPQRLADHLMDEVGVAPDLPLARLRRETRLALLDALTAYPLPWTGDEGYKKAEVTGGGVDLGEVDPRTLESRRHPRLYLCGELLDAFGPIGGYNFAWAWATGRLAGRSAGSEARASGA